MENNWEFLVFFFPKWRQKQVCLQQLHFLPSSALILPFSCSDFTVPHCFFSLLQFHIPTISFLFFSNKNDGIFFLRMASHSRSESCRREDWPVVFTYSLNYKAAGPHFYSSYGEKIAGISADLLSVVKTDPGASRSRWKWRISTMTLTTATSWPFLDTDKNGENKAWLSLLAFFSMNLLLDASFSTFTKLYTRIICHWSDIIATRWKDVKQAIKINH